MSSSSATDGCIPFVRIPIIEEPENERLQALGNQINTLEVEFRKNRREVDRLRSEYSSTLRKLNSEFNERAKTTGNLESHHALIQWMVFYTTLYRYSYAHSELKLYRKMYDQYFDCLQSYLIVEGLLTQYSIGSEYSHEIEYFGFKRVTFANNVDDYFSKECIGYPHSVSGWDLIRCNRGTHSDIGSHKDQYVFNYHYAESSVHDTLDLARDFDLDDQESPCTTLLETLSESPDPPIDHSCNNHDCTLSSHTPKANTIPSEVLSGVTGVDDDHRHPVHSRRYLDSCKSKSFYSDGDVPSSCNTNL